eukprot:Ihof_evm5s433 gene=Ihof_evmTU5s433
MIDTRDRQRSEKDKRKRKQRINAPVHPGIRGNPPVHWQLREAMLGIMNHQPPMIEDSGHPEMVCCLKRSLH